MESFGDRVRAEKAERAEQARAREEQARAAEAAENAEAAERKRRVLEVESTATLLVAALQTRDDNMPVIRFVHIVRGVNRTGRFFQREEPFERTDVLATAWPLVLHREKYEGTVGSGSHAYSEDRVRLTGLALMSDSRISAYMFWKKPFAGMWEYNLNDYFADGSLDLEVAELEVQDKPSRNEKSRILPDDEISARHDEIMKAMTLFAVDNEVDPALLDGS